ncbi:subtilisin-like protein [Gloeopeniophorella convolvens]|nr:subtilisin-like protein [Gloeopeniophorella convolvens]
MRSCQWLIALAALARASPAPAHAPRWDDMQLKHAWADTPDGWELLGAPPPDATIDLRIALAPQHDGALAGALYEVSDPQHEKYGQHLSQADVAALVAPHADTLALVHAWLAAHALPAAAATPSHGGAWLTLARVPVRTADALLGAAYGVFRHTATGATVLRTTAYSLPAALHAHVRAVAPTTFFGAPAAHRATSRVRPGAAFVPAAELPAPDAAVPSSCTSTITPACLRALYNTSTYVPAAPGKNTLGISGYLEEFANHADLTTFLNRFRADAAAANFTVVQVNGGGNDQTDPGTEANLDIQYAEAISFPTPNVYFSTGGSPPFKADGNTPTNTNEPYLDWLDFILAQSSIPQTISTSYGDDEQTVPPDYAQSVCSLFAQLGAQGVSVLFSSGDSGVGDGSCTTNDGTNRKQFIPNFPASCPFVTAVGGTTRVNPEVAASLSSGGFSNYFARPSYQAAAVTAFLTTNGNKNSGLFNTTGRGFPDIAAQAENFQIVVGGRVGGVDGTSCASPTAAAVISLLNDFLIAQGKPPLGFLNPLLYSTGVAGLNDITSGTNPGCGTQGFSAVKGWDPVTGLGTPDFGKLQAIVG